MEDELQTDKTGTEKFPHEDAMVTEVPGQVLCAQAWKPSSQHAGEKRGVAGLLLGRTDELPERRSSSSAPRRGSAEPRPRGCSGLGEPRPALPSF